MVSFVGEPGFHAHTAYLNTPLEAATRDFFAEYAFLPRKALYWPFGNEGHTSTDGWYKTDKQTLLWADKGSAQMAPPQSPAKIVRPARTGD